MPTTEEYTRSKEKLAELFKDRKREDKVWHRNHNRRQIVWANFRRAENMLDDVSIEDAESIIDMLIDELSTAKRRREINSHK